MSKRVRGIRKPNTTTHSLHQEFKKRRAIKKEFLLGRISSQEAISILVVEMHYSQQRANELVLDWGYDMRQFMEMMSLDDIVLLG